MTPLALFVRFVRMNPRLPDDSAVIERAFLAYMTGMQPIEPTESVSKAFGGKAHAEALAEALEDRHP